MNSPASIRPASLSLDSNRSDHSPPRGPGAHKPTYAKRGKITIVACVYCRRRKTKCDGKRPVCSQCQARDGKCFYDMNEEQRRLTYLRENVELLVEEKSTLEGLIRDLRSGTDEDASRILRQLRAGADMQTLAEHVQSTKRSSYAHRSSISEASITSPSAYGSPTQPDPVSRSESFKHLVQAISTALPQDVDEIVRRVRQNEGIETILAAFTAGALVPKAGGLMSDGSFDTKGSMAGHYSTREQTFGLMRVGARNIPENEMTASRVPNAHSPLGFRLWTIPADPEFIGHLLSLYFSWQHSFFQSFPEHLFRSDMNTGRTKFCSKLLVSGICAAGSLLSARPEARRDPADPLTAGIQFFDEGICELKSTEVSSIPTIAALFVLAHVEGYRGRMSKMWDYSGRSARMALDLNLHLRSERTSSDSLSEEAEVEEKARIHTFWGCFIADQIMSFTLGRLPQIPTTAITVELPPISKEEDDKSWVPHGDGAQPRQPGARSTTFHEVASLSKIVNSTLLLFFAPSQTMRGSLLLGEYEKYKTWYARLPAIISSTKDAPPHVISLHMYYHAAVLLLFRPFLKARFTESSLSPSDICRQAAASISDLFSLHRRSYDTVGIYTFQLHCLLTACTIHIINIPAIASTTYLTDACNQFHDLVRWNEWATRSLDIIKGLVSKWNIILSVEAEMALYRNRGEMSTGSWENSSSGAFQTDMFRSVKRLSILNPSSSGIPKRQKLSMPRLPGAALLEMSNPSDQVEEGGRGRAIDSGLGGSPTKRASREQQSNILFAPFPNQPAPLLEPIHTSTQPHVSGEFGTTKWFDGLSFEGGGGWFDPFMGYHDN